MRYDAPVPIQLCVLYVALMIEQYAQKVRMDGALYRCPHNVSGYSQIGNTIAPHDW